MCTSQSISPQPSQVHECDLATTMINLVGQAGQAADGEDTAFTTDLFRTVKEQEELDENEKKMQLPFGVILVGISDSGKCK